MSTQPDYSKPPNYPPPPQSSSTVVWVVLLVLVLVIGLPILAIVVVFAGCCGLFGIGAYSAMQIPAEMAKQQYASDPVIQQHIGELQSVSLNITATSEEQQKQAPPPGSTLMVFDVRGPKGSGQIIAEQAGNPPANQPGKFFSQATLRTSQGEFPLSP